MISIRGIKEDLMVTKVLALATGSITGGFARHYVATLIYRTFGTSFPHGTLVVNAIGCFFIGFLSLLAEKKFLIGPHGKLLFMTGFCGAFTTFSTFILETSDLIRADQTLHAFLNVILSVAVGFAIFRLGVLLGEKIV